MHFHGCIIYNSFSFTIVIKEGTAPQYRNFCEPQAGSQLLNTLILEHVWVGFLTGKSESGPLNYEMRSENLQTWVTAWCWLANFGIRDAAMAFVQI